MFELYPEKKYQKEIVIAPHANEAYLNIILLKLSLYCKNNNIKLTSIGSMNQLPFFSIFSDKVILQDIGTDDLFTMYSSFGTNAKGFQHVKNYIDVYDNQQPVIKEAKKISKEMVINFFANTKVFFRKQYFDSLNKTLKNYDDGMICCEIKNDFYSYLCKGLQKINDNKVIGIDKKFQKEIAAKNPKQFMTLQVMLGLMKGWRWINAGGSCHVFSILPCRSIFMSETDKHLTPESERCIKALNMQRYGSMPQILTFPFVITGASYELSRMLTPVSQQFINNLVACGKLPDERPEVKIRKFHEHIEDVKKRRKLINYLTEKKIEFFRNKKNKICDMKFDLDGSIKAKHFNESFWSVLDNQLFIKNNNLTTTAYFENIDMSKKDHHGKFLFSTNTTHSWRIK